MILEALQSGSQSYEYLLRNLRMDREALDCALQGLLVSRKVIHAGHLYSLPKPLTDEKPIEVKPKVYSSVPCAHCGGLIQRKNAKYCSIRCHGKSRLVPKNPCPQCGKEVDDRSKICCSLSCAGKWRQKKIANYQERMDLITTNRGMADRPESGDDRLRSCNVSYLGSCKEKN